MGLLQNLAAVAIRNKVVGALREGCPAALKDALESLLSDKAAINAESIMGLTMPQESKDLLAATPALVDYLVRTAVSKLS